MCEDNYWKKTNENWRFKWYELKDGNKTYYQRIDKKIQFVITKIGFKLKKLNELMQYYIFGDKHPCYVVNYNNRFKHFIELYMVKTWWFIENKFIRG